MNNEEKTEFEDICKLCGCTMSLPFGLEPTEICNTCAQSEYLRLLDLLDENKKLRNLQSLNARLVEMLKRLEYSDMDGTECFECGAKNNSPHESYCELGNLLKEIGK